MILDIIYGFQGFQSPHELPDRLPRLLGTFGCPPGMRGQRNFGALVDARCNVRPLAPVRPVAFPSFLPSSFYRRCSTALTCLFEIGPGPRRQRQRVGEEWGADPSPFLSPSIGTLGAQWPKGPRGLKEPRPKGFQEPFKILTVKASGSFRQPRFFVCMCAST